MHIGDSTNTLSEDIIEERDEYLNPLRSISAIKEEKSFIPRDSILFLPVLSTCLRKALTCLILVSTETSLQFFDLSHTLNSVSTSSHQGML